MAAAHPGPLDGQHRRLLRQRDDRVILGRMQTELLNRQRWKTHLELADAIFEYLEIFHNRRRRHSALGMLTPIEYELRNNQIKPVA
jgi:transposase InsO family protein